MAMRYDEYASLDAVAMAALVRKGDVTPKPRRRPGRA